eukprot:COSAG01_NODE_59146_length_305_cov_0.463054_1_plen_69_part_01
MLLGLGAAGVGGWASGRGSGAGGGGARGVGHGFGLFLTGRQGGSCFFNDTATTEIYTNLNTLSLHDALP